MRPREVTLRDGYRRKGLTQLVFAVEGALCALLFVIAAFVYPHVWWLWLGFSFGLPFLVFWVALPPHVVFMRGRSPAENMVAMVLQMFASIVVIIFWPLLSDAFLRLLGAFAVVATAAPAFARAVIGTGYVLIHWRFVRQRALTYLAAMRDRHPVEVILRNALREQRDLRPDERAAFELHVANVTLEAATRPPPASVARMYRIRERAIAERLEAETQVTLAAIERLRADRIQRAYQARSQAEKGDTP